MIDGYAILAVNEKGDKAQVRDHFSHDYRLQDGVQWSDMNMEEVLLPNGVSNCLIMIFFSYHSVRCGGYEYEEWEDVLDIENQVIMQSDFKLFEQKQISGMITHDGHAEYPREFDEQEKGWFDELIENWQLLHDEEFTLYKEMKSNETIIQGIEEFNA